MYAAMLLIPLTTWFLMITGWIAEIICMFIPLAGRRMPHGVHPDFSEVWLIVIVVSIALLYWNFKSAKRKP